MLEIDVSENELKEAIKLKGTENRKIIEFGWEFRDGKWLMFVSKSLLIKKIRDPRND